MARVGSSRPRRADGESVVVHSAAGGVGSLTTQLAKPMGAGRVIATGAPDDPQVVKLRGALNEWVQNQHESGSVAVGVSLTGPDDAVWTGDPPPSDTGLYMAVVRACVDVMERAEQERQRRGSGTGRPGSATRKRQRKAGS